MFRRCLLHAAIVLSMAAANAFGQAVPVFNASELVKLGDIVRYGSYEVIKIGDGIYQLKVWAEDTQKLVDYMKANFTPYERYSLKVYTGHSVESPIPDFISPNHGRVDIACLNWRFVQDQASCGNAILKGQWQVSSAQPRA